ncbi:MAG: hypothetical protein JKY55_09855 [Aliivibrio sp.]|nr:hypothetical protein [Aliivibrio sp.]
MLSRKKTSMNKKISSTTRRKRMLINNHKKTLNRHRAYMITALDDTEE